MVSLKRNSKLELVEAKGKRTRSSSIYTPGQLDDFKISRGKFSTFITCPRCFYLDRVVGLAGAFKYDSRSGFLPPNRAIGRKANIQLVQ